MMKFTVKRDVFAANKWQSLLVSLLSRLAIDMIHVEVSEGEFSITNECRV